jgi:hypothetical protein
VRHVFVIALVLGLTLLIAGCGASPATTTTPAAPTTGAAPTTSTAAPTTTTLSDADRLAEYRVAMKALWDEYESRLTAAEAGFGSIDPNSITAEQITIAQDFASLLGEFVLALGRIEPPQSLAAAHATYADGYQKISTALSQELDAMAAKDVPAVLTAAAELLTVLADKDGSRAAAESTLESALGFSLSSERGSEPTDEEYKALFSEWGTKWNELPNANIMNLVTQEGAGTDAGKFSQEDIATAQEVATTLEEMAMEIEAVKPPAQYAELHAGLIEMVQEMADLVGSAASMAADGATVKEVQSKLGDRPDTFIDKAMAYLSQVEAAGLRFLPE